MFRKRESEAHRGLRGHVSLERGWGTECGKEAGAEAKQPLFPAAWHSRPSGIFLAHVYGHVPELAPSHPHCFLDSSPLLFFNHLPPSAST